MPAVIASIERHSATCFQQEIHLPVSATVFVPIFKWLLNTVIAETERKPANSCDIAQTMSFEHVNSTKYRREIQIL